MKYLLINGSPHKGNTWKLVEEMKTEIAVLAPETEFHELMLATLNLPFCLGCSLCFRKGHEYCPHNQIVQKVIDEIEWADGVIFSTTTFNMQPTALTKNMLDHLCFMLHRPRFFTKKAIVVSTTGGVGAQSTVKYVSETLSALGFNKCFELPVTSFSWNDFMIDEKVRKKCVKLAHKFHKDVCSEKLHYPKLIVLMPYNLFRGMSLHYVPGSEYETEDGSFWTQESRAKRAYGLPVPIPFYKKIFGNIFYGIGKLSGKIFTVTYKK